MPRNVIYGILSNIKTKGELNDWRRIPYDKRTKQ
jgi:hypothetical protein